jgi:hypothetical protein
VLNWVILQVADIHADSILAVAARWVLASVAAATSIGCRCSM